MRIAFVLNDLRLSGGVNVVLQYASRIAEGNSHEVALVVRDDARYGWAERFLSHVEVIPLEESKSHTFDIAVATYWETVLLLGHVHSQSFVWFCQLYEDRFFPDRNPNIATMQIVGSLPIPAITEATWIKNLLMSENPDRSVELVLNGIDKAVFFPADTDDRPSDSFRVLIEGPLEPESKGTALALSGALGAQLATDITHVGSEPLTTSDDRYRFIPSSLSFQEMGQLYREHHVLVKTPVAEGMFGPPLEAFHCGTPAIVTPVSGSEEYIVHDYNAWVVGWSNPDQLSAAIDALAEDPEHWQKLSSGALATAAQWPTWEDQAQSFERALLCVAPFSKMTRADLANLGRTIGFVDLMHWLAMRRLSDKAAGPGLVEAELAKEGGNRRRPSQWKNKLFGRT